MAEENSRVSVFSSVSIYFIFLLFPSWLWRESQRNSFVRAMKWVVFVFPFPFLVRECEWVNPPPFRVRCKWGRKKKSLFPFFVFVWYVPSMKTRSIFDETNKKKNKHECVCCTALVIHFRLRLYLAPESPPNCAVLHGFYANALTLIWIGEWVATIVRPSHTHIIQLHISVCTMMIWRGG